MAKEIQPRRSCEAPSHVDGGSGFGETKDHFTPKCIAKLLKWKPRQISDPMNIQYLSQACHREKDSTTPARLQIVKEQLSGKQFTFEEYVLYFNKLTAPKAAVHHVYP